MRSGILHEASPVLFLACLISLLPIAGVMSQTGAAGGGDVTLAVQCNSPHRTTLTFEISGFTRESVLIHGLPHLALSMEHAGVIMMSSSGHPRLPALCNAIVIPDASRMEARVVKASYYEIEEVDLVPHRGVISRSVDPSTVPFKFGPVYGQDALFPAQVVSLRDPHILHDVRGQVVEVYPLQYNPVTRTLRVHTQIQVEVVSVGPATTNILDRAGSPQRNSFVFEAIYRGQFCNYLGARGGQRGPVAPTEDGQMVIIAHGPFMPAMQPLIAWKNSIGLPTTMVDVATIGSTASAIKGFITSLYNTSNLSYVLLVGDHQHVVSGTYGSGAESDPYYSTLTPDAYPDVIVGRFSAETVAHVNTQVQRTLEYEQAGHSVQMGGWNARGMGIASNQGVGAGHYGEGDWQHEDLIRNELLTIGFTTVDQIYDPGASASNVSNGLNAGRRCVHYTGHGSTNSWGTSGFNSGDINNLTNVGKLPFVNSVACLGGNFSGQTCFGEAWLRATHNGQPTGAIAAYTSSINQYWAPPMYGQGNHALGGLYGGADRFWAEVNWSVGGCWYGGSCTMMTLAGSSGEDMFETWHLFGDPSVRIGEQPRLKAETTSLSLAAGTPVTLSVNMGANFANRDYLMLPGVSGHAPGIDVGSFTIPLNYDLVSFTVQQQLLNSPLFDDFSGVLDPLGKASAIMDLPAGLDPALAGITITISGVTLSPLDAAMNHVEILLTL